MKSNLGNYLRTVQRYVAVGINDSGGYGSNNGELRTIKMSFNTKTQILKK